jgi:hypothetical protein
MEDVTMVIAAFGKFFAKRAQKDQYCRDIGSGYSAIT